MSKGAVPIVIPAYEPGEELIRLVKELVETTGSEESAAVTM